jgi:hypothetical protein
MAALWFALRALSGGSAGCGASPFGLVPGGYQACRVSQLKLDLGNVR